MNSLLSKIWFPVTVVAFTAVSTVGLNPGVSADSHLLGARVETITEAPDTIIYPTNGYKKRWTEEDFKMGKNELKDTLDLSFGSDTLRLDSLKLDSLGLDSLGLDSLRLAAQADTIRPLTARDTIKAPDSLRLIDPFRYKYYVALLDSLTHVQVRDSLKAAGDSLDWPKLDSLYVSDSIALAKLKFDLWYAGLSKVDRKVYDMEQKAKAKLRKTNQKQAHKDSVKAYRDSIIETTPRILETFALPDSLLYKRFVEWTHEKEFHKLHIISQEDTTANYRFYDYPFQRKDVSATWLGVAGSPVQYYNYFNRKSTDKVSFYEAMESWSWTPSTVPNYNTKTPYTELGYYGTLFAGTEKESDNLHILTTQNITPEFNFLLDFDRFGGGGILQEESTANKNTIVSVNYLGKRYMAHAGYIYNYVNRQENGGIVDNFWIRDTSVNARELDVKLHGATSKLKKNTIYVDQQYRIPFTFIDKMRDKKEDKWYEQHYRDSIARRGDSLSVEALGAYLEKIRFAREAADTTSDRDVTTAFIGHSSEFSAYRRWYSDKVSASDKVGNAFYHGHHYLNPLQSADSMRVSRFENRAFIRLQPWAEDGIISKLNLGAGSRILSYYVPDPTFTRVHNNEIWNSEFIYAGAEGRFRNFINWDAKGEYVFVGKEVNDLNVDANLGFNFYPFRKARKSPVSVNLHFETDLDEPEFYQQHMLSNHYRWDNDFSKISTTRIQGSISIPRWKFNASAGYALLANNVYYDTLGIARQNGTPMSVLSATLDKEFVMGPLHLDNKLLFQLSSNEEVMPLPTLALNLRYYLQFNIQGVLQMQTGINALYNTAWYSPAWNPALGVFHNQNEIKYTNGPHFDVFANMQWKRACIFVKYENAGQGWPMKHFDYFSAHQYIWSQRVMKLGIYWPFYTIPGKNTGSASGSSGSHARR